MKSVLKTADSKKCKRISEVTEKLRNARESVYSVFCKSRGMDTFRDSQKICNRRHVLPDNHETTRFNCY